MFTSNHRSLDYFIFCLIGINLILWNILVPVFELPSEHFYLGRVQQIVNQKSLVDLRQQPSGDLVYPDTYPLLLTPVVIILKPPPIYQNPQQQFNPHAVTWISPQRGIYNRFTHFLREKQFQWNSLEWTVHLMRLITSLFTFLSLILIFKTAVHLFRAKSFLPYAILLFTGFHAKFIHRSASLVNLPLLLLAFSLFYFWALTRRPGSKTACLLGLATGLGLVTKITALNLVIFFAVYLLIFEPNWRNRLKQSSWFMVGLIITSGWNLVRNYLLYGDLLALNQAFRVASDLHPRSVIPILGGTFNYWYAIVTTTFATFWDGFGWEILQLGRGFLYLVLFLTLASLWGGMEYYRSFINTKQKKIFLWLGLTLILFGLMFIRVNTQFFTPQGKDFFPLMLPLSVWFISGINHWIKQVRLKPMVGFWLVTTVITTGFFAQKQIIATGKIILINPLDWQDKLTALITPGRIIMADLILSAGLLLVIRRSTISLVNQITPFRQHLSQRIGAITAAITVGLFMLNNWLLLAKVVPLTYGNKNVTSAQYYRQQAERKQSLTEIIGSTAQQFLLRPAHKE